MAEFLVENLTQNNYDPNFVYRYQVGHGPNAVKVCCSAKLKFGRRALIEYDDKEGAIFIRSCSMRILKEIVASL